jgi:hypothetical protein
MVYDQIISGFCTTLINLSPIAYNTKMVKLLPLLPPSPAPLGGLRAANAGTHDDRNSEAWHIRGPKGLQVTLCQIYVIPRPKQL